TGFPRNVVVSRHDHAGRGTAVASGRRLKPLRKDTLARALPGRIVDRLLADVDGAVVEAKQGRRILVSIRRFLIGRLGFLPASHPFIETRRGFESAQRAGAGRPLGQIDRWTESAVPVVV